MCQIEVEQGGRKGVMVACNTKIAEGMTLHLNSEPTKQVQASIMEFLLLNHPLDCPICDDAGECKLQNYYMLYDRQSSRMGEPKHHKAKVVDLGPNIVLDAERCVLCSRCVRFLQEVVGKDELGIFNSGAKSELSPLPGAKLDNDYSGNIVDLCPVGALTDKRFRFKRRVWYLKSVDSICPGCSRGCNIEIHLDHNHRWQDPARRIQRVKPRLNFEVNGYWLCDYGRYGWDIADSRERLLRASIKHNGSPKEVPFKEALDRFCAGLKSALVDKSKTALIFAPKLSIEAMFALKQLVKELGITNVDYRLPSVQEGQADNLLQMKDSNPNTYCAKTLNLSIGKSLDEIIAGVKSGEIQNLIAIACDPGKFLNDSELASLKFFGALHWAQKPSLNLADALIPLAVKAETEGTFINFQGRVQRFHRAFTPLGDSLPPWKVLGLIGNALGCKFKAESEAQLFGEFTNCQTQYKDLVWDKI
jgi:NADH-quinone oxidoreductase subunit G